MTIEDVGLIAQIFTPIILLVASGIGWLVKRDFEKAQRREERIRELEEKLRDERIEIYNTIVEPYIILLTKDEKIAKRPEYKSYKCNTREELIAAILTSVKYRKASFKLVFYGSDPVIKGFNRLMQHAYRLEGQEGDPKQLFTLFGNFLLEIRRNIGNESTNLKYNEMFESFLKDTDRIAPSG